ncbi:hypothetical protein ACLMJK_004182 [Lecanora helva]
MTAEPDKSHRVLQAFESRLVPQFNLSTTENALGSELKGNQNRGQEAFERDYEDQFADQRLESGARGNASSGTQELEGSTRSLSLSSCSKSKEANRIKQKMAQEDIKGPAGGESRGNEPNDLMSEAPCWEIPPQSESNNMPKTQLNESSTSAIQSIMDQFDNVGDTEEDVTYTDDSSSTPYLSSPVQHPPRRSSLEPLRSAPLDTGSESSSRNHHPQDSNINMSAADKDRPFGTAEKQLPLRTLNLPQSGQGYNSDVNTPSSPKSSRSLSTGQPPVPDPEPDLPFDFHRFLEQLRHRTADPVAKFLRSFLVEFGKKQWMVHEQVKIIQDFLAFITTKMAQCEVWRGVSDAEFENAKEGMEKLVMNRLYSQTFSPAIPPPVPLQGIKSGKNKPEKPAGPGRKGQHQEDIERDEILGQKVRIYGWVEEEHLDIPPVSASGRRFLLLAQQGLLRNSKSADTSADSFVPLLIIVLLHANPDHLVSNVQYVLRFRNQDKLAGEAGYYLSSLMGAIQFIENLDRTSLTISDADFESKVEEAVSAIAERHREEMPTQPSSRRVNNPHIPEKSTLSQPEVVARNSIDAEYSTPQRISSSRPIHGFSPEDEGSSDSTPVSSLLRTIQRPLSSLGRMFSEDNSDTLRTIPEVQYRQIPSGRLSPAVFQPPPISNEEGRAPEGRNTDTPKDIIRERRVSVEDAAARQASAETAEAQRIQRIEHHNVVETLASMFPNLDKDVIDDVVRMKQGR